MKNLLQRNQFMRVQHALYFLGQHGQASEVISVRIRVNRGLSTS